MTKTQWIRLNENEKRWAEVEKLWTNKAERLTHKMSDVRTIIMSVPKQQQSKGP